MGLLVTWTAGLVLWVVLWSIGVKSFDAFMLVMVMMVVAAAAHIIWPMLPGNRSGDDVTPDNPPFN
ncbi:MAG TPA: hypothetical protein VM266_12425 [Solirubrobacteraceae bacterium]|nr:hypothetical protein [Solirubrobacteraceae bacterium]